MPARCLVQRRAQTADLFWHTLVRQDEDNQGMLAVIDVWESSVLVQSLLTVQRPILNTLLAAWHPVAVALVLSYGIILHRPQAFAAAGIMLATLPRTCRLENEPGMGFFPKTDRVLASMYHLYDPLNRPIPLHMPYTIGIVRCKVEGSTMLCTLVYERTCFSCHWGPCSSLLVFNFYDYRRGPRQLTFVVDLTAQQHQMHIAKSSLGLPLSLSPSGRLVADSQADDKGARITCLSSGMELWLGNISAGKTFGDSILCGPFLPSGCGLVVGGSDIPQQLGMLHILTWG